MEPGAVGGAGHGQVQQLAGCAVADAVNAVTHADKAPLLLRLMLVLAQTDGTGFLGALHGLNDVAGVRGNGVKVIGFDHGLCNSFHGLFLLWIAAARLCLRLPLIFCMQPVQMHRLFCFPYGK